MRAFVNSLKHSKSESTKKVYPTRMILEVSGLSSGAYYRKPTVSVLEKRGPKTSISDNNLILEIRKTIKGLRFHGAGYKKITFRTKRRLREKGITVGKNRVYNLMKQNNLLQRRVGGRGKKREHNGSIHTDRPNEMWGTDAKKVWTDKEGWCNFFGVIDHFNSEIITFHMSKSGDRLETLRPVQDAVKKIYGSLEEGVALGTALRLDLGTSNTSSYFKDGAKFLDIDLSYSWARSPECNGMIERFHRTLDEQILQIHDFKNLEEAKEIIGIFIDEYNEHWIFEDYDYCTALEKRAEYEITVLTQKTA